MGRSRLTTRRRLATLNRIRGASSVKGVNVGAFSLKSALGAPLIHFRRLDHASAIFGLGLCAQQGVSLAGESPAAPSQGGCVDKRPGRSRRPRGVSHEEGRVSIARWNPKGLRRTSGP